jgi:hypothetical protein
VEQDGRREGVSLMPAPREALAAALQGFLTPEQMTKLIDEVLAIEKRTSVEFNCKFCGRLQRQYGSVGDAKAVALALPDLLNQAYGRPSEAGDAQDPITFKRITLTDDDEAIDAALKQVEERRSQQAERAAAATVAPANGGSEHG